MMCNMCARSGSLVLENSIMGRVCKTCYNQEILGTNELKKMEWRRLALSGELEGIIKGHKLGETVLRAIADSVARYQMKFREAAIDKDNIILVYEGRYKRSPMILKIFTVADKEYVVCKICNVNDIAEERPYIERKFYLEGEEQ